MNRALEQPPILSGPAAQQAQLLRDYLVRMVRQLQTQGSTEALEAAVRRSIEASAGKTREAAALDARRRALELKSLIVKTADEVVELMDRELASLSGVYVAQSDFGVYAETTLRTIEDTARQTVESFQYDARLDAANAALGTLEQTVTSLNGQIRRGVIEDPATHEDVLGIAISENVSFTGQVEDENGVTASRRVRPSASTRAGAGSSGSTACGLPGSTPSMASSTSPTRASRSRCSSAGTGCSPRRAGSAYGI